MADRFYHRDTMRSPYPYYRQLRETDPVHRFEDDDVYLATRYADCEAVLGEFEVFSNKAGPGLRQRELMSTWKAPADAKYRVVRTLLTNDPPSHTRFRQMVNRAFSPTPIAAIEAQVRAVSDEQMAGFPG